MDFQKLNLPNVNLKTKLVKGTTQVFDVVRKKYFKLTAEEWVRQHFIHYLHDEKRYPLGLMSVEKMVKYNNMQTRADLVLYNNNGDAMMLVECKAPNVQITQNTFNQIARYNFRLRVDLLVLTNGMQHFCCEMNYYEREFNFLNEIPSYQTA